MRIDPVSDLKPYDSEYTGYMGNDGNTIDRWYRRAAIVGVASTACLRGPGGGVPFMGAERARARLDAGDLVSARAAAESVAPFWKAPGSELLEPALDAAAGLEDPGIALCCCGRSRSSG